MKIVKLAKALLPKIPYVLGRQLARIPYQRRPVIGRVYAQRLRDLRTFGKMSPVQQREFIFERTQQIVEFAFSNVPFYRDYYGRHGFHPSQLKDFDCIRKIPVVAKSDLIQFQLNRRSAECKGDFVMANTGGSTGTPLEFYIQTSSYGHEKAHMDSVWKHLGYTSADSTLTFSGRSHLTNVIQYDGLRHAQLVDIYRPFDEVADHLERLISQRRMPRFLHGYPSAIFDFLTQLESERPNVCRALSQIVDGTFFGSEYPTPVWRQKIETLTSARSVSWYGHTERCVLAHDANTPFEYEPMQTYGYAETQLEDQQNVLIGTSYYNYASPFIRYSTGDNVEIKSFKDGLLRRFSIAGGRTGEYVLDAIGKKIPLTGLIYGRHHDLFNYARSIQVKQDSAGFARILYSTRNNVTLPSCPSQLFDQSNVGLTFEFEQCPDPILTRSGKLKLLIDSNHDASQ